MACKVDHVVFERYAVPHVLKGFVDSWKCRSWSPAKWAEKFGDRKLKFRIGRHDFQSSNPLWEKSCRHVDGSLSDFVRWSEDGRHRHHQVKSKESKLGIETLTDYSRDDCWCYADYVRLSETFEDPHILQVVDWSPLGFSGRHGGQSTIWIGSGGAHTPCHQDSYGYNLVAQLYGRKRWILFDPSESSALEPTRIPFEESSVYSGINMSCRENDYPLSFTKTSPYEIILEPGDVLYVPHRYWHYVQSLETSISINTWIEMDYEDNRSRLNEAIVRSLTTAYCNSCDKTTSCDWLNYNEELTDTTTTFDYIRQSINKLSLENSKDGDSNTYGRSDRGLRCSMECDDQTILKVPRKKFADVFKISNVLDEKTKGSLNNDDIMKCLTDPKVTELIAVTLLNSLNIKLFD
ncbi:HSPBAP1 (predicted) [Pycnogonum litorale]